MKRVMLIIAITLLIGSAPTKATHIIGGEFSVKWKTGNVFTVTMNFYRDCKAGTFYFDTPSVAVGIYDLVTNANQQCINIPFIGVTSIPLGDSCYIPPNLCVELGTYQADVTIPNNPNGYYITYSRCCRNAIITNIQNPGAVGETWYAAIPDPALHNSAPQFGKFPKSYFCVNNPNTDTLTCTDVDGDSLVYSLITPLAGHTTSGNPLSFCPDAGPYPYITWKTGYSAANMVGGSPPMSIDRNTGVLTANPNNLGVFVFCVRVEEYRRSDKKKLGEVQRDIQYQVLACAGVSIPVFLSPTSTTYTVQAGDTLSFPVIVQDTTAADSIAITGASVLFTNGTNTTFIQPVGGHANVQSGFMFIPACTDTGTFHVRFKAEKQGCFGTVTVYYDLDITVTPPDLPYISSPTANLYTIYAGDMITFPVIASDGDPADSIYLTGRSELFTGGYNTSFSDVAGLSPVQSTFNYISSCNDIRDKPYHVKFTVKHCYKDSAFDLDIVVKPPVLDSVPNIFTPNGDMKNDFFRLKNPVSNFNCEFSIKIFDRWGLLMYESSDANFKWDGTNKSGNRVPEGVYYYIIEALVGPSEFKQRGTVNVKM